LSNVFPVNSRAAICWQAGEFMFYDNGRSVYNHALEFVITMTYRKLGNS